MISVVIPVETDEPALIDTLAALVPAAADGLVRDLVLAAREETSFLRQVSDAAGCAVAIHPDEASLAARVAADTKGPWVMVLSPGFVPGGDWMAEAADFIENAGPGSEAAASLYPARGGLRVRLACKWANLRASVVGQAHPHLGLLGSKATVATPSRRVNITRLSSPIYDRRMREKPRIRV